jgi:uncharacterized damage-inducible protein DinB
LRTDLIDAQRTLVEVIDGLGRADWDRPAVEGEWTVRQLVVHLVTAEGGFVPALRRITTGAGGVPADFDPNRWNAAQQRRRTEFPVEQLGPELAAAHTAMLALLDGLDDAALDFRGRLSSGVEGSAADNFRLVASHKRAHTQEIVAALRGGA